jgi:hypothetical protein
VAIRYKHYLPGLRYWIERDSGDEEDEEVDDDGSV